MLKATARHVLLALALIVPGHALAEDKAMPDTQSADAATPQSEESNSPTVEDRLNELEEKLPRTELLIKEERLNNKEQWLSNMVSSLTLTVNVASVIVGVTAAIIAIFGVWFSFTAYRRDKEAEKLHKEMKDFHEETRKLLTNTENIQQEAEKKLQQTTQHALQAEEMAKAMRNLNAEGADKEPDRINQVIRESKQRQLSDIGKAIIGALELQKDKRYEEALAKWLAIAELTSDRETAAKAYSSAAYLIQKYKDLSMANKAIELFSKSIKLHPTPSAYNNRGIMKRIIGKYKEAIADLNEAIKLNPDLPEAFMNRGNTKSNMYRYDGAIDDFNEAIRLKPDDHRNYNNRGDCYRRMGKYDDAMRDVNKSIELKETADAYHTRGEIYSDLSRLDKVIDIGKLRKAIKYFSKAIDLNKDDIDFYISRGQTYRTMGEHKDALADFKKAFKLDPENEEVKKAIEEIEARGKND